MSRQKDLEAFLEHTRKKFVGFAIKDDLTTLIGLPKPIHESIKILKEVIIPSHELLLSNLELLFLAFIHPIIRNTD